MIPIYFVLLLHIILSYHAQSISPPRPLTTTRLRPRQKKKRYPQRTGSCPRRINQSCLVQPLLQRERNIQYRRCQGRRNGKASTIFTRTQRSNGEKQDYHGHQHQPSFSDPINGWG